MKEKKILYKQKCVKSGKSRKKGRRHYAIYLVCGKKKKLILYDKIFGLEKEDKRVIDGCG